MKKLKPFALALAIAFSSHVWADDLVTLNFVNNDIESTVKAVSLITGRNFILDPRVKGTVNVVSTSPVPRSDVYNILLSALRLQGFAVVESAGAVKIVPEADAKQNNSETVLRTVREGGDRMVTQIYPLKNESASQLVPILRPLITPNNSISAYAGSNLLVITDYADNVKRLDEIIANIDQASTADLITLQLKYASAIDVAQTIGRLMPEVSVAGGNSAPAAIAESGRKTVILADTHSNSLFIRGDNQAHLALINRIIETLDKKSAAGGNLHVIYLKNADASKLAGTLKAILTGQDVPQSTSTPLSATPSIGSGSGSPSPGLNSATATSQAASSSSSSNSSVGGGTVSPGVAITADPTTNALIVTAPDNVYANLREVIDKLDARRAQVYVEAMIAEVNMDKVGQFGVQWLVGGGSSNVTAVGASSLSASTSANIVTIADSIIAKTPVLPSGLTLGLLNGSLSSSDGRSPTLGFIANALESNGNGNVLSTPNILMLDNEEASIIVGQNLPFVTGTQAATGSNPNPFTTIDRKDVGITLKVKPQVSEGGSITMQVYQEVSSVDTTVNTQGAGLATKKRSIQSKVLVDDGQVIVLGGLIENDLSQNQDKIPLLGDLPILGNLFRYETRQHTRTDLMVFIRPVILRDGQSAAALTNQRYRELQDSERGYLPPPHFLLPSQPEVVLPVYDLRKPKTPVPADVSEPPPAGAAGVERGKVNEMPPAVPAYPQPALVPPTLPMPAPTSTLPVIIAPQPTVQP